MNMKTSSRNTKEHYERTAESRQRRTDQAHEIMRASRLNLELLDKQAQEDEADLNTLLQTVRLPLIQRASHRAEMAKRLALFSSLETPNVKRIGVYTTTIMASDPTNLDGIQGERGNPWVLPLDPSNIKLKARNAGSGWACGAAQAYNGPDDVRAVVWFPFTPDTSGLWNLRAVFEVHGFYYIKADKEWYDCKNAWLHVRALINAYQYSWQHEQTYDLLHIDRDTIDQYGLFDKGELLDYQAALQVGNLVWVALTIWIRVYGNGSGSYSEVNFSDGVGNYIRPIKLLASPAS